MIAMNVKEARRLRLLELIRTEGTLRAVAQKVRPGYKYFDRYLSQVKTATRGMGDKIASRFEKAYHKPNGWMDYVGSSSIEANELLHAWSQFPPEEQERIVEELKIRLRVRRDKESIKDVNPGQEAQYPRNRHRS